MTAAKNPLALTMVIPDHPWVDGTDGASVRIAMTAGAVDSAPGLLSRVVAEEAIGHGEYAIDLRKGRGVIHSDLRLGPNIGGAAPLKANEGVCFQGVKLVGSGFRLDEAAFARQDPHDLERLTEYWTGRDVASRRTPEWVIDLFGLEEFEARESHPGLYQRLLSEVKPFRDQVARANHRERWWLFGEARPGMRKALSQVRRYVVTSEVSKFRNFTFLPWPNALSDGSLMVIASDAASIMGVLSSCVHGAWALAAGGRLGVGNDPRYSNTRCFLPFPFPNFHTAEKCSEPMAIALVDADGNQGPTTTYGEYPADPIRNLAEQLDAHRKRQQAAHPGLTLTGMYNVLEKLRSGDVLSPKERSIHEQGLVSVLRQLHDELDDAVLAAYGWGDLVEPLRIAHGTLAAPEGTTREDTKRAFDEAILERLVALNAQRALAEARGEILWLRPDFQNPEASRAPEQHGFEATAHDSDDDGPAIASPAAAKPMPWPKDTVDQVRAVAEVLDTSLVPLTIDDIAARFTARGPWKRRLPQLLAMLVALGRVREADGAYVAS